MTAIAQLNSVTRIIRHDPWPLTEPVCGANGSDQLALLLAKPPPTSQHPSLTFPLGMNNVQSVVTRLTRDMLNSYFLATLSQPFQSSTNSHGSLQRCLVSGPVTGAAFPHTALQNPWFSICFQEAVSSVQSLQEQYIFLANCFS